MDVDCIGRTHFPDLRNPLPSDIVLLPHWMHISLLSLVYPLSLIYPLCLIPTGPIRWFMCSFDRSGFKSSVFLSNIHIRKTCWGGVRFSRTWHDYAAGSTGLHPTSSTRSVTSHKHTLRSMHITDLNVKLFRSVAVPSRTILSSIWNILHFNVNLKSGKYQTAAEFICEKIPWKSYASISLTLTMS